MTFFKFLPYHWVVGALILINETITQALSDNLQVELFSGQAND